MPAKDGKRWLDAGIAAVKSGDKETARALLMKVVREDERNEQAWLWLSAVAATNEDQRICFENVLALNPDSRIAQKGLARLSKDINLGDSAVSRDTTPSPTESPTMTDSFMAQAESRVQQAVSARDPAQDNTSDTSGDVWDTEEDICAFCAARVEENDKKCRRCDRSLVSLRYRYPATGVLHVYWVLLLSLGLILVFQALFKWRFELSRTIPILHASLAGALVMLVFGVYLRLFWAHIGTLFVLIMAMMLGLVNFFVPFDPAALGMENVDAAFRGFTSTFFGNLGLLAEFFHVAVTAVALFYATLRASPEFDRVSERNIARTEKGLHTDVDYHMIARQFTQDGRWASAILHWQRAASINPNKAVYLRNLARAYINLGFFDRGLRVLQSARELPLQPSMQSEIERLIQRVERRIPSQQR
jgi:tetratricopeptide (TPR) repeat protein